MVPLDELRFDPDLLDRLIGGPLEPVGQNASATAEQSQKQPFRFQIPPDILSLATLPDRQTCYRSLKEPADSVEHAVVDAENFRLYDKGLPIPTSEVSWHCYLSRLSHAELKALTTFISPNIFDSRFLIDSGISLLAVGTTTFPPQYWHGLERFASNEDPAIAEIVKRQGEDIDVLVCSSMNPARLQGTFTPTQPTALPDRPWFKEFLEAGRKLNWKTELTHRNHEDGTGYLYIPAHERRNDASVHRYKQRAMGPSIIIKPPNCRPFHFRMQISDPLPMILRDERCTGRSFSLLLESGKYWELHARVKVIQDNELLFSARTP